MVNSIQGDKFTSLSSERSVGGTAERTGEAAVGTPANGRQAEPSLNDRVSVSDTGRLLSVSAGGTRTSLTAPEQARELAARIREQFQSLGGQAALDTHSGANGALLSQLLETSTT